MVSFLTQFKDSESEAMQVLGSLSCLTILTSTCRECDCFTSAMVFFLTQFRDSESESFRERCRFWADFHLESTAHTAPIDGRHAYL